MGAISKNMNGISFENKDLLKDFQCSNCHLFLDDKDLAEENYSFWFSDYANEITKTYNQSRPVYGADFWLKGVDHENCPESEKCSNCYSHFRTEEVKEYEDNYYCLPCYQKNNAG